MTDPKALEAAWAAGYAALKKHVGDSMGPIQRTALCDMALASRAEAAEVAEMLAFNAKHLNAEDDKEDALRTLEIAREIMAEAAAFIRKLATLTPEPQNALAALEPTPAPVSEPVAWKGYWPGAGSINSSTMLTSFKLTAEAWERDGAEVTPLYPAPPIRAEVTEAAVERVAARLWLAEVEDTGSPPSIIASRTPEAFAEESTFVRRKWDKIARAALQASRG